MRPVALAALTLITFLCIPNEPSAMAATPGDLPEDRLARLRDPLPGLERTPTSLSPERVRWILQYGNCRMMTGLGSDKDPAVLAEDLKKYHVTFITHSLGAAAISFCNRYKTPDEMKQNSLDRRGVYKTYHDAGVLALPYIDTQRCTRTEKSQTYEHWDRIRKDWEPLMGPLPENIDATLELAADGKPIWNKSDAKFTFSTAHPFQTMRAFTCIAIDLNNGGDGSYFDNHCMSASADFNPLMIERFRRWLAARFTPAQRKDLFGTDNVAQLSPPKDAKASGPIRVAWLRFRSEQVGWVREQMMAFGRSIDPAFVMMSTYYSHAGAPFDAIISTALDVEDMTLDGKRDSLLFWEPGTNGPAAGETYAAAKAAAETKAKTENKPAGAFRFGQRSFSCSLRQMVGASYVPVVSKQAPAVKQSAPDALTELCMAESYANLVTPRTYKSSGYHADAVIRMHVFQESHPELFIGAQPRSSVALWCSSQQAYAGRREADAVPFSRKLSDIGLDHQIIPDRRVTPEGLKDIDLLFAYKTASLTDEQIRTLDEFRKRGTLVVVGGCGTHDEWNRARKDVPAFLGDLPARATEAAPAISADKRVVVVADGALTKWYGDLWYRHSDDGDMAAVKVALEQTYGKAWPWLTPSALPDRVEITLADIASANRALAHVVNYKVDTTGKVTPTEPMELAVKLTGERSPSKATFSAPENGMEKRVLPMRVEQRNGARYAVVTVPAVNVYGIVAIE